MVVNGALVPGFSALEVLGRTLVGFSVPFSTAVAPSRLLVKCWHSGMSRPSPFCLGQSLLSSRWRWTVRQAE